jgi:hypothetical protein
MSLKNLFKAILIPNDLYSVYALYRRLGCGRFESLKYAVDCVALYCFVLP